MPNPATNLIMVPDGAVDTTLFVGNLASLYRSDDNVVVGTPFPLMDTMSDGIYITDGVSSVTTPIPPPNELEGLLGGSL